MVMNVFSMICLLLVTLASSQGIQYSIWSAKSSILSAHNNARRAIARKNGVRGRFGYLPRANSMPSLTWDNSLASTAWAWAKTCNFGHSSGAQSGRFGENIYYSSATPTLSIAKNIASGWIAEAADWTYSTVSSSGSCRTGKKCGHYTAVIWAKTTKVGCAIANCRNKKAGGIYQTMAVCQYSPTGNYRGQYPYTKSAWQDAVPMTDGEPTLDEPQIDLMPDFVEQTAAVSLDYVVYGILILVAVNMAILVACSLKKSTPKKLGYGVVDCSENEQINV